MRRRSSVIVIAVGGGGGETTICKCATKPAGLRVRVAVYTILRLRFTHGYVRACLFHGPLYNARSPAPYPWPSAVAAAADYKAGVLCFPAHSHSSDGSPPVKSLQQFSPLWHDTTIIKKKKVTPLPLGLETSFVCYAWTVNCRTFSNLENGKYVRKKNRNRKSNDETYKMYRIR